MSSELERAARRLREIAAELGHPALDDGRAEELAREAAELAAEAGSQIDAAVRESAGDADV